MTKIGFKSALLISVSVLIATSVSMSNYLAYQDHKEMVEKTIYKGTQDKILSEAHNIERFITNMSGAVSEVASDYRTHKYSDNHDERMRLGGRVLGVTNLMVGFENGDAYASADFPGWINHKNPESYEPRKRPWYTEARSTNGVIYTEPYKDANTGELLVSIGQQFHDGVVLADISLEILDEVVKSIDMPGALAVIMTADTSALATTSSAVQKGKKLSEIGALADAMKKVTAAESSVVNYQLNGVDKVLFSRRISYGDKHWYLTIGLDKDVVFASLAEAKKGAIILTLVLVVASVGITLLLLNYLYRPILNLKEMIHGLSRGNGDLTQRLEVKTQDDLGQIANDVNVFIESLQSMMLEIDNASNRLRNDVVSLVSQANTNSSILEQHVIETEQIVTAIEEMNATADSVALNANEAAGFTSKAAENGADSMEVVSSAQSEVTRLVADVEDTSSRLTAMSDEAKSITGVLQVIGDIAEQTNLLALNAAIEAARAGEQGRGFAVVADEVRALASRTQESTHEIENALNTLLSGTESVVMAMSGAQNRCQSTFEHTDQVSEKLQQLVDSINGINDLSAQIATAAEEQSSVATDISRNMSTINDMVGQLNANGEETRAQSDSIGRINQELSDIVSKFKLA